MSSRPDRRTLCTVVVTALSVPLVAVAAVLAFAWPTARIAPRNLPVGIVGISPASQQLAQGLDRSAAGGFDIHVYADQTAARRAIEHRDVYGAFVANGGGLTVLTASAAGPPVAQLLTTTGRRLAQGVTPGSGVRPGVHVVDVVATSRHDPRGLVFDSALLPLTICSILLAAMLAVLRSLRPARRQVSALVVLSSATGVGVYLVAQPFLGALPHQHLASASAIALTVLAISSATAGFVALFGPRGLGVGAALMMFVGNAFSGVTSAPQLLPEAVNHVGQLLPPGAGASLLRSTAYFGDHGAAGHVVVLLVWAATGLGAVVIGQRFAPPPGRGEHEQATRHHLGEQSPEPAPSTRAMPARPHDGLVPAHVS